MKRITLYNFYIFPIKVLKYVRMNLMGFLFKYIFTEFIVYSAAIPFEPITFPKLQCVSHFLNYIENTDGYYNHSRNKIAQTPNVNHRPSLSISFIHLYTLTYREAFFQADRGSPISYDEPIEIHISRAMILYIFAGTQIRCKLQHGFVGLRNIRSTGE